MRLLLIVFITSLFTQLAAQTNPAKDRLDSLQTELTKMITIESRLNAESDSFNRTIKSLNAVVLDLNERDLNEFDDIKTLEKFGHKFKSFQDQSQVVITVKKQEQARMRRVNTLIRAINQSREKFDAENQIHHTMLSNIISSFTNEWEDQFIGSLKEILKSSNGIASDIERYIQRDDTSIRFSVRSIDIKLPIRDLELAIF